MIWLGKATGGGGGGRDWHKAEELRVRLLVYMEDNEICGEGQRWTQM